ncbi:hypothetical protein RU97_GL000333 [Enterococcus canis]|uniref:Serine aminopeptidase S33 domain-containing protein n=1 Tax=Enterococcus canis TaxID=214095 RepID=A0A1L8RJZ7_9ENTE|nr:alpha/beta hydrolase [Enterococcus canis]OJG20100.1 hypothetical protein RU97_GL000333 [Enterococcus canis]
MLIGFIILLGALIVGLHVYAGHFFAHAALERDHPWYKEMGHKKMNPSVYEAGDQKIAAIEAMQQEQGAAFWETGVDLTIEESGQLVARVFRHPEKRPWVICVHGYRSNGKRDMAYPGYEWYRRGYQVLIPDLRAHGRSSGKIIGMGWNDRQDLIAWLAVIRKEDPEAQVILYGGSMGASTVMMAAGESLPTVSLVIADCGYTSVYEEFYTMLKQALKLPPTTILWAADPFIRQLAGFSLKEASAVRKLHHYQGPLMVIHGTGDHFVPVEFAYQVVAASQGPKELHIVAEAPHLSAISYDPAYFDRIEQFIRLYGTPTP